MSKFTQGSIAVSRLGRPAEGFILLEVLVAMGLVVSSWMALGNSYQHLILRLGQIQEQRAQIKKELDQHELAIFATMQSNLAIHNSGKGLNESSGVSRRSRSIARIGGAPDKK